MELDVTQLPLKDNSIIVWRTEEPSFNALEEIGRALREAGYENCVAAILHPDDDLTVLSDEDLDRMGLQRKNKEPLTGYWYATGTEQPVADAHGHYIENHKEAIPVAHIHKGGRRAHFHEEGDTNGNPSSQ